PDTQQKKSSSSEFTTWGSQNNPKSPLSFSNDWPPTDKTKDLNSSNNEWPNMRTDVYVNEHGKLDGPGKIESKIPLLLGAMSSKRAKKLSYGSQLSHSEAKRSQYKKLNPVNEGDLDNWVIVIDAERLWLRCCIKISSKKAVRSFLRSDEFFLNSERQFAVGEEKYDLAVDWNSLELIRQQFEIENQESLPKIPHKRMGAIDIHRISDKEDLTQLKNTIKKHNNKLLKIESNNSKIRQIYSQWHKLKALVDLKTHTFVAIDCEMWEQNHNYLTEFGWMMYNSKNDLFLSRHYIIADHYYLENKKYVGDQRDKFVFGNSVVAPLKVTLEKFVSDIKSLEPVVIIGHDMGMDLKILKKHGIDFSTSSPKPEASSIPSSTPTSARNEATNSESTPSSKFNLVDTSILYMGLTSSINEKPSLSNALKQYGVSILYPHNAGNDAVYTMRLFLDLVRDEIPTTLGKPASHLLHDISDVSLTASLLGPEPKPSSLSAFATPFDVMDEDDDNYQQQQQQQQQQQSKTKSAEYINAMNIENAYDRLFNVDKGTFKDLPVYKRKSQQFS
ncbi:hypothetical protein AYI69_g7243, partial [Smittium culicis]